METGSGSIALAVDSLQVLREVADLLNSDASFTRAGLYDAAARVTRVHNMLEALNLDLANRYRDLVTEDLAAVDPAGWRAPLTGQRLAEQARRVTGQDLSPAWHMTPNASRKRVGLARTATDALPECVDQVRRGEATEDHLTAVLREAVVLEPEDQARMDHDLAHQLPDLTVGAAKAAAFKRAAELDAATMVERAERAARHAHVSVRPAPDCMTRLSALLPLKDGVAIEVALTRHAQKLKAHGDTRSLGQIKAALLVAWVRDGAAQADQNDTRWNCGLAGPAGGSGNATARGTETDSHEPGSTPDADAITGFAAGSGTGSGSFTDGGAGVEQSDVDASAPGTTSRDTGDDATCQHGPSVEVLITITDLGLLGFSDTPAHVDGYGAVPAGLARQIIRDAAAQDRATLRRLWSDPKDGTLTQMESRSRFFPKGLARFIRARDQVCRTPYCGAPIRQIDHIKPHSAGGATTATNGQGLCTACNQAKEHTRIRSGAPPGLPQETPGTLAKNSDNPPGVFPRTG
ncbi:HNH endonuclease signature motif containing protein [Galactobacter sp.]|uniref:HNH endonuclease n=1 Tax=Galactobacter sp. TaxID=2676125 RepID=UPI0025C73637|nr:HNH endonuclease signature motif containing protein [Galactobacter sp.]